ncbi:MAG: PspC domain-containing protein [Actinomycetota bacterium]
MSDGEGVHDQEPTPGSAHPGDSSASAGVATDTPAGHPPDGETSGRLTRSRRDRVLAGVAGGLGQHFGVDPLIFRIGFVAFSLLGASGLVLYGIAWLVIPEEGARRSVADVLWRRWGRLARHGVRPALAGTLLLAAAAALLVHDAIHWGAGRIVLSVALLGAGIGLLAWRPVSRRPSSGVPEQLADEPDARPPAPAPAGPTLDPPDRGPRERSVLTRIALSALLVLGGAAGLAQAAGIVDVTAEEVVAVALVLTGLGLLVGAWWGRAHGLIAVGVVLTLVLGALTIVDVPFAGGFGERTYRPVSGRELRPEYRLFAGEMLLDLSRVDIAEGTTEIDVSVAFGELTVVTPPTDTVVVVAHVGAGELRVLGEHDQGVDTDATRVIQRRGAGTVRLDLRVVAGEIRVSRATS